jgi:hypothetical protein
LDRVADVLRCLADVVEKLTSFGPHPFFCFKDAPVDRENHHQSRAGVLPLWEQLVRRFRSLAGEPRGELQPLRRGEIVHKRAFQFIAGLLTTVAAQTGYPVDNIDDAIAVLRQLEQRVGVDARYWAVRWERKARRYGTLDQLLSFPPTNEEGGTHGCDLILDW